MNAPASPSSASAENAVKQRYAAAAHAPEAALCCPVSYDPKYLQVIPAEVIEKDYGCGDPSRWLKPGETVLDLGSGTGKICFIAAQVVGSAGKVVGVDMTDDMLAVARRNAPLVAERLGYANVEFRKGRIQDLGLDLEQFDRELRQRPVTSAESFLRANELAAELRVRSPLIPDQSVDVVVSNCVLNLVEPAAKRQLFAELFRVLKTGGRAVISDIVADEPVPVELQNDPRMWSGCLSGALTESEFLRAFAEAGFYGVELLKWDAQPWQTVAGLEFRSVTVRAFKGRASDCLECNQAVMYLGPFSEVCDDDGHRFMRGQRVAVCDQTFQLLRREPYAAHFAFIEPRESISPEKAQPFDCSGPRLRHPRETKGQDHSTTSTAQCCSPGTSSCC